MLALALRRRDAFLLGSIVAVYRRGGAPFSDKQIALLRELRRPSGDRDGECPAPDRNARGLEYQTATGEVFR